ncbi:MAG: DNA mismatch endonuclease Vsr [Prevotella sp.]|nr:DNA mismatch endonuclease Vsr [Prevotella sp.]MBQ6209704.1 DNA mismatch endonuclease Vsr [Prevotella sp.]
MALTKEQRSKIMAAIHSKDTKPEMAVRRYLHACGFRYRVNSPRLPGHPDLVLRKYRTCIFVNGCFWHGHDCQQGRMPKTNIEFWNAKIERNRERDVRVQRELAAMGWHCITVWECELTKERSAETLRSLEYTLNHIYLKDHVIPYPRIAEECDDYDMAAETITD